MGKLKELALKYGIELSSRQEEQFEIYYNFLVEYNNKVNLTAITEKEAVYKKHFIDSIIGLKYLNLSEGTKVIDIGTGAGFPSVPLKIMKPEIELTLMDSLNKRLVFLDQLLERLELDATLIHQRAEDIQKEQREYYDIATSRAVAELRVLCEYDMPYVKLGGYMIAYKGKEAKEEVEDAKNAINILGGQVESINEENLFDEGVRNIVCIKKIEDTPDKYPRKAKKIERDKL